MDDKIVVDAGRLRKIKKEAYGMKPQEVNANTERVMFYRRYLWRLICGRFEISVPYYWNIDYVREALLLAGGFAVTKVNGTVIPYIYNTVTRTPWRYPLKIVSGDGMIKVPSRVVGENAEIIYLQSAFVDNLMCFPSISDLLDVYAQRLALCDGSIDINLINTRTPWICEVEDKSDSFTLKALMTKIYSGEPAVFWRRKQGIDNHHMPITTLPVTQNYVAGDVESLKIAIVNEFLSQIGVSVTADKKEYMGADEIAAYNAESYGATSLWEDNLDLCCEKVNKMFGEDVSISIKIKNSTLNYKVRGGTNGANNS